jgi:hypothetical protein
MIGLRATGRYCFENSDYCDRGFVAYRSPADVAIQHGLGLLPQRRARCGPSDSADFGVDGAIVNEETDTRRVGCEIE